MKKIFISIDGVTHAVVDLKISASGYHGHNLVGNQKHLESINNIFIEEDIDVSLSDIVNQFKIAQDRGKEKIKKKIKKMTLRYPFSKQRLFDELFEIARSGEHNLFIALKILKKKLKNGEIL